MHLLIDGGMIIFKASSPADGRTYIINEEEFKYKKEATTYCDINDFEYSDIKLEYRPEPVENALHNAKVLIHKILDFATTNDYTIVLKVNKDNYRNILYTDYKANRQDVRRPYHEKAVKQYLLDYHPCELVTTDIEEDDLMGILHDSSVEGTDSPSSECTCIVSHDKDMLTVPGKHIHVNYDGTMEVHSVSKEEGYNKFLMQCLTGDSADNIPGLYKTTGQKVTKKVKEGFEAAENKWEYVRDLYGEKHFMDLLLIAELLWILR